MFKLLTLIAGLLVTQAQSQTNITYRVEYAEQSGVCGGTNLGPLYFIVPPFSTVLNIMEAGVEFEGLDYQFITTFTTVDGIPQYVVDQIGQSRRTESCHWSYLLQSGGEESRPRVDIASYVPGNDFEVILLYEPYSPVITTTYIIEHPDSVCTSATPPAQIEVAIPINTTALGLMEEAVRMNGSDYAFSVIYGDFQGFRYSIVQVGGVPGNGNCFWAVYVTTPSGAESESLLREPISEYVFPGNGYILTLRLREEQEPTTVPTTPSPTTSSSNGSKPMWSFVAMVLSMVMALFKMEQP